MRKWLALGLVALGCGFVLLTLIPSGPTLPRAAADSCCLTCRARSCVCRS